VSDRRPRIRTVRAPTPDDLARARAVVAAHLPPAPLLPIPGPDGREIWCKLESAQPTGAFKVRGALAALADAPPDARVVTASAGNHGLGVAYAAARLGRAATIVVPRTASPAKLEGLRRGPAELVLHGERYEEAEAHALALADQGSLYVSAYNDTRVIAGQATCAAEIAEQLPGERTLVVPVGGGGLLAGVVAASTGHDEVHVVAVEAQASRAVSAAVARGRIVPVTIDPTLADGLAGNLEPGAATPGLVAGRVRAFVAVSEEEIEAAVRFLAAHAGWVVEGAGAVGMAALLAGKVPVAGRAVVLLTGRNIATSVLARLLR
jgi:threonine dehydratase